MGDRIKYIKEKIDLLRRKVSHIGHRFKAKGRPTVLSHLPNDSQKSALYTEIQSFNYFDEYWYRIAYRDEIEYPDDLLLDYIKAGIPNGRDPSPYFNTILYRREQEVPPEQALVHFLRSGRTTASGAYRDEQALLAAQQAFRAQTETDLIADRRSSEKLFAVYLQCGSEATWRDWQPNPDQPWHLLINHYDSTFVGKIPCDVEFRQAGTLPGTKSTSFSDILTTYSHILDPYQYILLLDDDIYFQNGDISRLFSIVQQHGWEMALASLSADSFCSFPVFFNRNKSGFRQVNGVEIMMPAYSTRILGSVRHLISESISGWGFDAALSVLTAKQGFRAAVVDDIVAQHTRPINADIGQYYQMLHRAQIYPEIEFTHLQKKYGFTKPLFYEI
jgi:hypothetical protein